MSDRYNEPTDLFDAICRVDDLADWLEPDYPDEARAVRGVADTLKRDIVISLAPERPGGRKVKI